MTKGTSITDIKRDWYLFDVNEQILGRQASKIAQLLMGKQKPYFVKNLDCGDYVVIVNAAHVKVTGKKETQKVYARHSGYPGGYTDESLKTLRTRRPEEIIRRAVRGMLPDNKLRDKMLKRLFVFAQSDHTYQDKKFLSA